MAFSLSLELIRRPVTTVMGAYFVCYRSAPDLNAQALAILFPIANLGTVS